MLPASSDQNLWPVSDRVPDLRCDERPEAVAEHEDALRIDFLDVSSSSDGGLKGEGCSTVFLDREGLCSLEARTACSLHASL